MLLIIYLFYEDTVLYISEPKFFLIEVRKTYNVHFDTSISFLREYGYDAEVS